LQSDARGFERRGICIVQINVITDKNKADYLISQTARLNYASVA